MLSTDGYKHNDVFMNLKIKQGLTPPSNFIRSCDMFPNKLFRRFPIFGLAALLCLQSATFSVSGAPGGANSGVPARAVAVLSGVHRIVFLGDSITQAGDYVTDCECWLLAHGFEIEVLNLGLG